MRKRNLTLSFVLLFTLSLCIMLSPFSGECSETWNIVSSDYRNAAESQKKQADITSKAEIANKAEMVEIEYKGKVISVDIADIILMADGKGGQTIGLGDPEKYISQHGNVGVAPYGEGQLYSANSSLSNSNNTSGSQNSRSNIQEITEREYEEEQLAHQWANIVEDLSLRDIDEKTLELVRKFGEAKGAVPPMAGSSGSVVITYSSYTPRIVCRPMYVTDIMLQPGELVTGVHPGDPVRWTFTPSRSGSGVTEQTHVLIKPLIADISTNLIINTDRRTYQLDLMSSPTDFIPSVSFSYPADSLKEWDMFLAERKKERQNTTELSSGYTVNPEDLYLDYEVRGRDSLRWKPIRVWDDGVKTYIHFRKGSTKKSVEAPVLIIFEHKKEVLVNYRVANDMYIVDRVFDKGALIVGTGAVQDRVVITRLGTKGMGN
ncbi:hypothetical protein AGMMS49957_17090 [Synergistales bacterium]|nr:hypothetical protein AGMMS49957_17090 [Synergistales bacterium]